MIEKNKFREKMLSPHASAIDLKVTSMSIQLAVCVRKRPIFKKE